MRVRLVMLCLAIAAATSVVWVGRSSSSADAETQASVPNRVLDTRYGYGARSGRLDPSSVLQLTIPGINRAGETAVLLNLTAVDGAAAGYVSAWPCSSGEPSTSVLNFVQGVAVPNMVALPYDAQGLCFRSSTPVHLIADVTGVTTNGDVRGIAPQRLVDTRRTSRLRAGVELEVPVAGSPGVPGDAAAGAINVTVTGPGADGYAVVAPCGADSDASTVNFRRGETVAHFTFAELDGGAVCVTSSVNTDVVVDSFGWLPSNSAIKTMSPRRLVDSRTGTGGVRGPLQSGSVTSIDVDGRAGVPDGVDGVVLNAVAIDSSNLGYVTIWPCDETVPNASTLNVWAGSARSNQAAIRLSSGGDLCVMPRTADGSAMNIVIDTVGYITESTAGAYDPPPPPDPFETSECMVTDLLIPTCGAWFGASTASLDGTFDYTRGLAEYEAVAQNTPDILHIYKNGSQRFPTQSEIAMAQRPGKQRSLLLYNWKPSGRYTWAQVAQGAADDEIDVISQSIKRYPYKLFLNIHHEPENDIRPAAGSGRTAKDYANMYRHVVTRLRANGVDNAVFVWNTMGYYGWRQYLDDLYPGDAYVDWLAYDPYGWALKQSTLESIVQDVRTDLGWPGYYAWVTAKAPGKPVMLAEWGFDVHTYPDPARILDNGAAVMQAKYPLLKAFVYWHDVDSKVNPRIDQQTSRGRSYGAAFRALAAQPYFNTLTPDMAP